MKNHINQLRTSAIAALVASLVQPASAQTESPPLLGGAETSNSSAQPVGEPSASRQSSQPASIAGAAWEGTQLGEIVVTAQRRQQSLQEVPLSVSVIGGADLKTRGIESVTDLGTSVSGLVLQKANGIVLPFLRGVGNTGNAPGNEGSVAAYVDGVYYPRMVSSFFELKNLKRVEVLKGPQGTLFGRNSTGGVINVITRDPSQETSVSAGLSYGRFNSVQGDLYVTTGLGEGLAADLSVTGKTSDGFGNNIATGGRYGYEDAILARAKLLWDPTTSTRILVSGFYSDSKQSNQRAAFPGTVSRSGLPPASVIRSSDISFYDGTDSENNQNKFEAFGGTLRIDQELGFADLVNITAYSKINDDARYDFDFLPANDGVAIVEGNVKVFSQELQLVNKKGSSFDWIVGAYYYNFITDVDNLQFKGLAFGPGIRADSKQKIESISGFAQATIEVLPKLKLTGGVRYTDDTLNAEGVFELNGGIDLGAPPPGKDSVGRFTFKVAADYQVTHDVLAYASFSRGFKSGNYGLVTYNRATPTDPEEIDAYELGLKTELFDRRVRFNAAAFYYNISNPQVQLVDLATNAVLFSNAGGSEAKGVEAEAEVVLGRGLTARASATYVDSQYTDYQGAPTSIPDPNGGSLFVPGGVDATGNRTPLAARLTFNVGADYTIETSGGDVTVTADWAHNSGYFFEPDNLLKQKPFNLVSAQIRYKPSSNFAMRLFGRNLLGERIIAAAGSYVGPVGYTYVPSSPRTWGIALDVDF